MTINKLHKLLGQLIEQGYGRSKACIDKSSFTHPLEDDGAVILDIHEAESRWVPLMDDDGGTAYRKDGTERGFQTVTLYGNDRQPEGVQPDEPYKCGTCNDTTGVCECW